MSENRASYECQCPIAAFCERHQTRKSHRDWQLCQGIECSPEQAEKYRRFWDERAGQRIASQTPTHIAGVNVPAKVYDPIPREDWPAAAKLIAMLAAPEDTGIGDTIKRQLGVAGKMYQTAFRTLTGSSCAGCGFRQRKWNQLYPY